MQAIKPVFMMSPISVAAYLAPGALEFDLVVFDEASQVKPVDAFGALFRAGRPSWWATASSSRRRASSTASSATRTTTKSCRTRPTWRASSGCSAKRAPERMLRWHYRSRHESLIAVSNHEFYEGRLVTFPSPDGERAEVGLVYHHLPEARYDRGGRRTNRARRGPSPRR